MRTDYIIVGFCSSWNSFAVAEDFTWKSGKSLGFSFQSCHPLKKKTMSSRYPKRSLLPLFERSFVCVEDHHHPRWVSAVCEGPPTHLIHQSDPKRPLPLPVDVGHHAPRDANCVVCTPPDLRCGPHSCK